MNYQSTFLTLLSYLFTITSVAQGIYVTSPTNIQPSGKLVVPQYELLELAIDLSDIVISEEVLDYLNYQGSDYTNYPGLNPYNPEDVSFEFQFLEDGVDYTTVHCGITKDIAKRILKVQRYGGVVSKGGTITAAWMLKHDKENPYITHYDYMMEIAKKYDVTFSLGDALRPGSILDSHDELQVQEMINISQLTKRAHENDVQVMVEGPGHVPLNEVAANVRLAKSLIGDVPYYVLGPLVTDVASGHDHIASAIGAAISASEGVDLLCYLTPSEHLALPNAEEVKAGLIAYRIAAHAGDLVKMRDKAIKWDMAMTEARRTLDWEKQIALSIDPEEAAKIHSRTGQHPGNNVPCTMCGGACVYMMLPQQKKYDKENENLQQIE